MLENKTTDHPFKKKMIFTNFTFQCMPIPVAHSFKKYNKIHQALFSFASMGMRLIMVIHTYIYLHVHGGNIPYVHVK